MTLELAVHRFRADPGLFPGCRPGPDQLSAGIRISWWRSPTWTVRWWVWL